MTWARYSARSPLKRYPGNPSEWSGLSATVSQCSRLRRANSTAAARSRLDNATSIAIGIVVSPRRIPVDSRELLHPMCPPPRKLHQPIVACKLAWPRPNACPRVCRSHPDVCAEDVPRRRGQATQCLFSDVAAVPPAPEPAKLNCLHLAAHTERGDQRPHSSANPPPSRRGTHFTTHPCGERNPCPSRPEDRRAPRSRGDGFNPAPSMPQTPSRTLHETSSAHRKTDTRPDDDRTPGRSTRATSPNDEPDGVVCITDCCRPKPRRLSDRPADGPVGVEVAACRNVPVTEVAAGLVFCGSSEVGGPRWCHGKPERRYAEQGHLRPHPQSRATGPTCGLDVPFALTTTGRSGQPPDGSRPSAPSDRLACHGCRRGPW